MGADESRFLIPLPEDVSYEDEISIKVHIHGIQIEQRVRAFVLQVMSPTRNSLKSTNEVSMERSK